MPLHRYPVESGAGFRTAVALGDNIDGGKPYPEGTSIAIDVAKLKIGDTEEIQKISADAINAVFEFDLDIGEHELKSWLIDENKAEVGAYYVYVQKI